MKLAVITNDELKEELLAQGLEEGVEILWLTAPGAMEDVVACIDLLFDNSNTRITQLEQLPAGLIFVNFPAVSSSGLPAGFIPFSGWRTLLKRAAIEAACADQELKVKAEKIFRCFNKTVEWIAGTPGFISARVISMIINEAWLALEEGVSTPEEIDIAMKLGTNYPYGPFEWGRLIGLKNVQDLLIKLAETNSRYQPSALLQQEAAAS